MHRCFVALTSLALFTASVAGQCLNTSSIGSSIGSGDETLFAPVAMGINFPMAGALGGPFTHCAVSTNGVLYLTTGAAPVGGSGSQWGGAAQLTGVAGDAPRIAPFWKDLVCAAPSSFVAVDTSVAGRCAVTWLLANEFLQAPVKSFQAELFATGVVRFSYSAGMAVDAATATVGVSVGNGAADPGTSDLSAQPVSATGVVYQLAVGDPWRAGTPNEQLSYTVLARSRFTSTDNRYEIDARCPAGQALRTSYECTLTL